MIDIPHSIIASPSTTTTLFFRRLLESGLAFRMLQWLREGEDNTGAPLRRVMGINHTVSALTPHSVGPRHRSGIAPWTQAAGSSIDCITSDASMAPKDIHSADI